MSHDNSTFERTPKNTKRAKPPGDFETSQDAKRVRERNKSTMFQRTDKRQQWQEVEF